MSKWIIRIIVLFLLLNIFLLLQTIDSTVNIVAGNYTLTTNLHNLFWLFLIVYIPIFIVKKIFSLAYYKISKNYNHKSIVKFLNLFSFEEEKNFLIAGIKQSAKRSELKELRNIKELINHNNLDKALNKIKDLKISSSLDFFKLYLLAIVYYKKGKIQNYIDTCKKGAILQKNNYWFFNKLVDYYVEHKNKNEIQNLLSMVNRISFLDHKDLEKATCMLKFTLSNIVLSEGDSLKAEELSLAIIKQYPTFIPAYKILIDNAKNKSEYDKVENYLEKSWKSNQTIDSIYLWNNALPHYDYSALMSLANKISDKVKNSNMQSLLKAFININYGKYIEAEEILRTINIESPAKQIILIKLYQAENNTNELKKQLDLVSAKLNNAWWNSY